MANITDKMIEKESKSFGDFLARLVYVAISFVLTCHIFWKLHSIMLGILDNFLSVSFIYLAFYCFELFLFAVVFLGMSLALILGMEKLQS